MQMRKRRPKHFRIRGPCLSQPINKKAPVLPENHIRP